MAEQSGGKIRRMSSAERRARFLERRLRQGGQRGAVHELHDHEVEAVGAVEVVHLHDVGVPQRGHGPRLAAETGHEGGVGGQVGVQELEGHGAVEARVVGLVHGGHAAPAHQARPGSGRGSCR